MEFKIDSKDKQTNEEQRNREVITIKNSNNQKRTNK